MTQSSPILGALIGSRICHDLISPVGAISNGLELLGLAGTPEGPEMALVSGSAAHASARLRFFRVAFGLVSGGQNVSAGEVLAILNDIYCDKFRADWQVSGDLTRAETQLAFLALLCAEQALPLGGVLTVTGGNGALCVTATGRRVAPRPEHWAILDAPGDARGVAAAQVQFALLPLLLEGQMRRPRFQFTDSMVTLRI